MPYRHAAAQGGPVAGNQAAAAQLRVLGTLGLQKLANIPPPSVPASQLRMTAFSVRNRWFPAAGFAVQVYPAPLAVGEIVLQHRPFLQAQSAAVETDQGAGASGRFPAAVHHNVPQGQGGAAGDREQDAGEAVAPGQNMAAADNVDVIGDKQTVRAADGEAAGQCDGGQPRARAARSSSSLEAKPGARSIASSCINLSSFPRARGTQAVCIPGAACPSR